MSTDEPARLLIAVGPPLFSDLLSQLLGRSDREILVAHDDELLPDAVGFDVAITSPRRVVPSRCQLHLPPDGRAGVGSLRTPEGVTEIDVRDIAALVDLVDTLCRH